MQEISSETGFPRPGASWLTAPDERTLGFLATFAEISVAIQTVLRARVPAAYFDNPWGYWAYSNQGYWQPKGQKGFDPIIAWG